MTFPRSPYDREGGLVYFPRMVEKIRLHARGELPADYHANLGAGFDQRCCEFLHVRYEDLVGRVREGGPDAEVLEWCCRSGRRPTEAEIFMWNEYLRKCGWNDQYSERLRTRLEGLGMAGREDVRTMFDLIEVDEGREPGGAAVR
jgi:gluconokinase